MNYTNKEMFADAREIAKRSPDTSRKTGVVVVTQGNIPIRLRACNEFPFLVKVSPERLERPAKYLFTEHAERNAIYAAARAGISLRGSRFWLPWFPCVDCARAIVQVGALQLTCVEPNWAEDRYNFKEAQTILNEGGVIVTFVTEDGDSKEEPK